MSLIHPSTTVLPSTSEPRSFYSSNNVDSLSSKMTVHHDARSANLHCDHVGAQVPSSQMEEHQLKEKKPHAVNDINGPRGHYGWNGAYIKGSDSYAFMRTCNASARLTAQHYLWKDLLGYLLHPNIPARASDLKLADIATGNGIWLHDYARNKPMSVELHGFDISLDQIGPKPWRPANVHMHTWNIFEDPDPRFIGYFDVVHVKLVTVVVRNDDPRPILANLSKLLKPGGYLQWDEVDTIGASIKTVPGVSAMNLDRLFSQVRGHDTWKYHLINILDENGYTGSELYTYEYPLGMASFWSDLYMTTWKEFAENVLKTPEVSNELERRAMTEARLGAAIMIPKLVWIARKL